uniref:Phage protein n=1 Tax=uncultured bacterium A1Q1_fos_25 TaxID=1256569 RepID=L7W0C6_9BACT|nr:phage protein [uncultured bacterium A1Q1_fos_25]
MTRSGIFVYRDGQGNTVRELRPPEEVMHPEALASFALVPVTNDHPSELLTADNAKQYAVGSVSESVVPEGDKVRASLMITDAAAIEALDAGKSELSCGYTADVEFSPGVWNGQPYDAVQRNIRGNHVALVDAGRAGPACAIRMDAAGAAQEITMEDVMLELGGAQYSVPADLAAELVKMLEAKGLKPVMGDAEKPAQGEEMAAVKADAQRKIDALQARLDALQSVAAAKNLRETIAREIREDMAVTELAKRFDADVSESDTIDGKRRKIVAKLDPSIKLDGKSPEYVGGLLDALVLARAEQSAAAPRAGSLRLDGKPTEDDPAEVARKEMMDRFANAHKKEGK